MDGFHVKQGVVDEVHELGPGEIRCEWSSDGTQLTLHAMAPVGLEHEMQAYLEHLARFTADNFRHMAETATERWRIAEETGRQIQKRMGEIQRDAAMAFDFFPPSKPILITDCTS